MKTYKFMSFLLLIGIINVKADNLTRQKLIPHFYLMILMRLASQLPFWIGQIFYRIKVWVKILV